MATHEFSEEDRDKLMNAVPDPLSVLDQIEAVGGLRDGAITISGFYDATGCDHEWIEVTKFGDPHRNFDCARCRATVWIEWPEWGHG